MHRDALSADFDAIQRYASTALTAADRLDATGDRMPQRPEASALGPLTHQVLGDSVSGLHTAIHDTLRPLRARLAGHAATARAAGAELIASEDRARRSLGSTSIA